MTMTTGSKQMMLDRIAEEIAGRQRFVISSHARPDGDSIGSQLAMAHALKELGKDVRVVNCDPAPAPLQGFPGIADIQIASQVDGRFDAAIVMECGDLGRTGVTGLDQYFLINIDHHPGNALYGALNWFDDSAAACGEMVFDIIESLGVRLTREIALHIYLAILTDTGAFHYSSISARTFDVCRRTVEAGVDPAAVARTVFDSSSLGRLKLFGAVLSAMELDSTGRVAVMCVDQAMARAAGGTYDDTEGLVNLPLTVKEIQAVAFFKEMESDVYRVSLRSKGDIDVGEVAKQFAGGGHKNASGCTLRGRYSDLRSDLMRRIVDAVDRAAIRSTASEISVALRE